MKLARNTVEDRAIGQIDRSRATKPKREKCPLTAAADDAYHMMRKGRGPEWARCWASAKAWWAPPQEPVSPERRRAEQAFAALQSNGVDASGNNSGYALPLPSQPVKGWSIKAP